MKWVIIIGSFYVAFGAIIWLGLDDTEVEDWDRKAMENARRRWGDTFDPSTRTRRVLLQMLLMMFLWPIMRWSR